MPGLLTRCALRHVRRVGRSRVPPTRALLLAGARSRRKGYDPDACGFAGPRTSSRILAENRVRLRLARSTAARTRSTSYPRADGRTHRRDAPSWRASRSVRERRQHQEPGLELTWNQRVLESEAAAIRSVTGSTNTNRTNAGEVSRESLGERESQRNMPGYRRRLVAGRSFPDKNKDGVSR